MPSSIEEDGSAELEFPDVALATEVADAYRPEVQNADNSHLGALGGFIGRVDFVNGAKANEVPTYVPTVFELELLFEHWQHEELDQRLFMFMTEQWGSTDARIRDFAARRANRILDMLGEKHGQKLWDKGYAAFWEGEDPRLRACFETGKTPARVASKWRNGENADEADWGENDWPTLT